MTADAEVEAFNAFAKWGNDQAQDDGYQQETLDASMASTNAAIETFTAKAESALRVKRRRASANLRLSLWSLWILSIVRSRFFQIEKTNDQQWNGVVPDSFDVRTAWPQCSSVSGHIRDQAIMYLLLILAMSVMAGATLVRAAKACFEGVWLERWKSAATPGYASRCGLHHVQTFGERIRVLHRSDGRALPYRSQDRLRKKCSPSLRRCCAVVQKLRAEHFVDLLLGGGRKGGSRATRRRRQEADVQKQLTSITAALATLQARVRPEVKPKKALQGKKKRGRIRKGTS